MNIPTVSEDVPALATHRLVRRFGRRTVIQGLDIKVPAGVVYGFLGRNGAGKTTTIRMLMGMLSPQKGRIEILGAARSRVTAEDRRRIGYVSQEQHFYGWMTVRQLERFVGGFYPTWSTKAFDRLADQLNIDSTQTVGTLSGGTKMKLAMALALAHKPRLLVLDEPTAGVDPIARREILTLLKQEAHERGRTVFFSTHQIAEVEDIGDWVGILHEGRMAYQGRVSELSGWVRKMPQAPDDGPFRVLVRETDSVTVLGRPDHFAATQIPSQPTSLDDAFYAITQSASS
ncbi:MAG: ABC transporter ATP-binding protein [Myxococcota bacterium]